MTSHELTDAETCAIAATAGPWTLEERAWGAEVASGGKCVAAVLYEPTSPRLADARFIATARTLVPSLVVEVRRLRAALERIASGDAWNARLDAAFALGDAPAPTEKAESEVPS